MTLRVAFCEYPVAPWNFGGKERRARALSRELAKLDGVETHWVSPFDPGIPRDFDLLQLFGLEYYQAEAIARAQRLDLPVFAFSILVFQNERARRTREMWRRLDSLVPVPTTFRLVRRCLEGCSGVFFANTQEQADARSVYGVSPKNSFIVRSTVDPRFAEADPQPFIDEHGLSGYVLYLGRIEPRKNPLNVLRAARKLDLDVVFVGRSADDPNDPYLRAFEQEANAYSRCRRLPFLDPDGPMLKSAYAAASVHVLASEHETAGLTNMESLLAGTNIVSTDIPAVREHCRDYAFYADPTSVDDLARALREARDTPFDEAGRRFVLEERTHPAAARHMRDAYRAVLGR